VLVVVLAWVGMALAGWLAIGSVLGLLSAIPGAVGRGCGRLARHVTPLLVRRILTVALGSSTASLALPAPGVIGTVAAPLPVGAEPTAALLPASPGSPVTRIQPGPGYAPTSDLGPGYHQTPDSPASPSAGRPASSSTSAAGGARTDPTAGASPGFRPTRPLPVHDRAGASLLAPAPRPGVAATDTVTVRRGDTLWSLAARHLGPAASDSEIARAWPLWHSANRAVIGDDPDLIRPGMQLVPPREGDLR
jgi:nucleoid-associated protein YgaU